MPEGVPRGEKCKVSPEVGVWEGAAVPMSVLRTQGHAKSCHRKTRVEGTPWQARERVHAQMRGNGLFEN